MPPKTKITKKMILDTAFELVRKEGCEALNARAIAEQLNCSTQPIMYNFKTAEELRQEVYVVADQYHANYIMSIGDQKMMPFLAIGLNYIRFGYEEKNLFRFLFQTNQFSGMDFNALFSDPALTELLNIAANSMKIDPALAKEHFRKMFIMVHGYASLFANNALEYDEDACIRDLCYLFDPYDKEEDHE